MLFLSLSILMLPACATYSQARVELSQEYVILADEFSREENYARAGSLYEKSLELYPGHWNARYGLIKTYLAQGDVSRAEALFLEAAGKLSNEGYRELQAYFLARGGEFGRAGQLYRGLLEEDPENYEYRFNLALTLIALEDFEEAYSQLERVIDAQPSFLPARIELAALDSDKEDFLSASLWLEEQSISEYPRAALLLARSYRELEYFDRFFSVADQMISWSTNWGRLNANLQSEYGSLFLTVAEHAVQQGLKDVRVRTYLSHIADDLDSFTVDWVSQDIVPGLQPEELYPDSLEFIRSRTAGGEEEAETASGTEDESNGGE